MPWLPIPFGLAIEGINHQWRAGRCGTQCTVWIQLQAASEDDEQEHEPADLPHHRPSRRARAMAPRWVTSLAICEVPGAMLSHLKGPAKPEGLAMSDLPCSYWANLAKTVDADAPGMPTWPVFATSAQLAMFLNSLSSPPKMDSLRGNSSRPSAQYSRVPKCGILIVRSQVFAALKCPSPDGARNPAQAIPRQRRTSAVLPQ